MQRLTYAIGDVHGCFQKLSVLVETCLLDAGTADPQFVFLGDYIDRGPGSRDVIAHLIKLQNTFGGDVVCLQGNHEDMLLAAIDDPLWLDNWIDNGGHETLKSYGVSSPSDIPKEHLTWMRTLPKIFDDGLRFFVHAGVRPGHPLDQQDEHDLLYIRKPFLTSSQDFGRLIVHGHTPRRDGKHDLHANRLNLDTAAVYGGPLTAAVFSDQSRDPLRFLST